MYRITIAIYTIMTLILVSCQDISSTTLPDINISILADGKISNVSIPSNSTVQDSIAKAGILIGFLDRVDPSLSTIVTNGDSITVIRVVEEFYEKTETIPYDRQSVKNESLPEGETRVLQTGINGEKNVTYKRIFEDGLEISNIEFKSIVSSNPTPEIIMIGVQSPFSSRSVSGILAYIDNRNAWIIDGSTGNRRPVVTTGDLDGHVFSVSYDREWLLYSRKSPENADYINSLWVIRINRENATPIDLQINNVIHFADWIPNSSQTIIYSTVEPRTTAPGWQANNDLFFKGFVPNGTVSAPIKKVEANSGGIYGWWGTYFMWSPDGSKLAYFRPDGIGIVSLQQGVLNQVLPITPYDTHSDWAWVPGFCWGPDSSFLFVVDHPVTSESPSPESSQFFSLVAASLDKEYRIDLNPDTGMFANPSASPILPNGGFYVAYLQAIFPDQSDSSRYRLIVMDQDGSNQTVLFPEEGYTGLNPQSIYWTPDFQFGAQIAILYEGNLWLVDALTQERIQVTGNGLISRIHWR